MEQICFVDPPNKPMDTIYKPIQGPNFHKDLIFIDCDPSGRLLVGSTNVTATYWEGSVQTFEDYSAYQQENWQSYYNSPIIHDGKFIGNTGSLLISESPSYLKVLSEPTEESGGTIWKDCVEHVELVRKISMYDGGRKFITAGDNYVSTWEINDNSMRKITDYPDYHTDDITDVAISKTNENIFASTGIDRRLIVWDERMENPALELYSNEFAALKSVSWNKENMLVVASEGGDLYSVDITQPNEFQAVQHCFKAPIHRIVFNDSDLLAVCGNINQLQVYSCKKGDFDSIYKGEQHSKFVRGLAWHKNCLFSSGFDGNVFKRNL